MYYGVDEWEVIVIMYLHVIKEYLLNSMNVYRLSDKMNYGIDKWDRFSKFFFNWSIVD